MGRPRIPTKLQLLRGTKNPGRLPKGEPEPAELPADTPPPEWLHRAEERRVWVELVPMLSQMGVLTVADMRALGGLCRILGQADFLNAGGVEVPTSLEAEARAYFARFGMTPADRARVSKVDKKPESKLERYVGGAKA